MKVTKTRVGAAPKVSKAESSKGGKTAIMKKPAAAKRSTMKDTKGKRSTLQDKKDKRVASVVSKTKVVAQKQSKKSCKVQVRKFAYRTPPRRTSSLQSPRAPLRYRMLKSSSGTETEEEDPIEDFSSPSVDANTDDMCDSLDLEDWNASFGLDASGRRSLKSPMQSVGMGSSSSNMQSDKKKKGKK